MAQGEGSAVLLMFQPAKPPAEVKNRERAQHVRTWFTLPNDGPQKAPKPRKGTCSRSIFVNFHTQSGRDKIHPEKLGLPICKIMQCQLPCLHPALFRLLGNSVLLGLNGFVGFWRKCLGKMFVVPCYLSTFHSITTCKANEATNINWFAFSVGVSTSKLSREVCSASLASAAITCNCTAKLRREK